MYSLNHHCTPLWVREKVYLDPPRLARFYEELRACEEELEGMVLFTCNRTELILHHPEWEDPRPGKEQAETLLSRICTLERGEFAPYAQLFWGREAVRHCFCVASGLNSMVIGEPQILGQWKDAFQKGVEGKGVRTYLKRLGERTLQVAKRVRSETQIGEFALSIPSLVVALAEEVFSSFADKKVYVIGAGEMGDLTLRYLRDRGARTLFLLSKTFEHAQEVAQEYGAEALPFSRWEEAFREGDLIVISLAAFERIFSYARIASILRKETRHPRLLFDLSVPGVVEPEVRRISDLFFYTLDDLKEMSERNRTLREEELDQAEAIIAQAVERFLEWYHDQRLGPLLARINHALEEIRREELGRARRNLGKRSPEESMEILSQAVIRKLMSRFARFARETHDEAFLLQLLELLETDLNGLEAKVEKHAP